MSAIIEEAIPIADFDDPNIDKGDAIIGVLEDDSPYPEVRSALANTDDILIPISTLRCWIIGAFSVRLFFGLLILVGIRYHLGSDHAREFSIYTTPMLPHSLGAMYTQGLNQFFYFRYPSVGIGGVLFLFSENQVCSQISIDRRTTAIVPRRQGVCQIPSQHQNIWGLAEPWAVHDQRTCARCPWFAGIDTLTSFCRF